MNREHGLGRTRLAVLLVGFFLSGFAALVYQVLWVRHLGLLFGSTAQAAAMAIAIFFAGIAVGGWHLGNRAPGGTASLRWFGLVELGVAATALGHFVLLDTYRAIYPALHAVAGTSAVADTVAKMLVATIVLFPSAVLMGGTLPLIGDFVVRSRDRLGRSGTTLYAVNTAGSAAGALAAGFVLPPLLGFHGAYVAAIAIDAIVGLGAVLAARRWHALPAPTTTTPAIEPRRTEVSPDRGEGTRALPSRRVVMAIAFLSGFATLGVEVIWTRLFAQVLHNSVYTYALVLTTFLVALALGAGVANRLARSRRSPTSILLGLLAASTVAVTTSPWVFTVATDGLSYVGADLGWSAYVWAVASTAALVMLVPGVALGTVLPYLLRTLESEPGGAGRVIGRLVATNTSGAIVGSLAAGFVVLPLVGATGGLLLVGSVYPVLAMLVVWPRRPPDTSVRRWSPPRAGRATVAVSLAAVAAILAGSQAVGTSPLSATIAPDVIDVREGPQATVAVVERDGHLSIRVNNFYVLGGTRARHAERNQAVLPMLLHPDPRTVFFLGMGTGITAGGSLPFPVERVVVCELIGDVVRAADRHFGPWTNGLFEDDRVEIHAEDGRNCLARSPETFDLIVSDLFTPWKAGTGNLYTREHFEIAASRLEPGGLFVQWLPLYQVSERELGSIVRTMDDVFEQVTLWRGDLYPERSIVAIIGHADGTPVDPASPVDVGRRVRRGATLTGAHLEALALRMYVGNATAAGVFSDAPLNTDSRPFVEYTAPRTHRDERVGATTFMVGEHRERFYDEMFERLPPREDPFLALLTDEQVGHVLAGRAYSRHVWAASAGDTQSADDAWQEFLRLAPPGTLRATMAAFTLLG